MKKRYITLITLSVIIVYLYVSHAYIYAKIGAMKLTSPQTQKEYILGDTFSNSVTYVALGDSLTAGVGVSQYEQSYPYLFAQKLSANQKEKIILKPFAIPGAKVSDGIELLLDDVVKARPDIITVLFGVNDVHDRVSAEDFYVQYKTVLNRLTKETDAQIYILAVPYIGSPRLILPPYNTYFDSQTKKFNQILLKLSEEYTIVFVDLYSQTRSNAEQAEYYSPDLFHPSGIGYTQWSTIVYDAFNK